MYKLLRSFLFLFDPEWVHYFSMNSLKLLCKIPFGKSIIQKIFTPTKNASYNLLNIDFKNKVGLAAGFDKNAKYLNELETLGFGFVEIGTVTPLPQDGNEQPRLFRLPKDKALINRMGFNNDGVEVVAERLKLWKEKKENRLHTTTSLLQTTAISQQPKVICEESTTNYPLIIGGNIGKNKVTPNESAWKDYEICFEKLHSYVDYFVVNVSSPNTPGLRELQEKDSLRKILKNLQIRNAEKKIQKPILLKIAPDLTAAQIDDVIALAKEINLDGLVVANTTIERTDLITSKEKLQEIGNGGLSGLPLKNKSTNLVKYIADKTNKQIPIIASGGIFTGKDAAEKFQAGASLVQVWTGFVYEGPAIVKKIVEYLDAKK